MNIILITLPDFFDGEASMVNEMLAGGLEILHLRKPKATVAEMENFILQIDGKYRDRVVLHSHFELVGNYRLRGAHLGVNRPLDVVNFSGKLSFSCHSFAEVAIERSRYSYVFLSPIFNSISKEGYASSFTIEDLQKANRAGVIDHKVVALGGVTPENCKILKDLGFGGVAILGDVWQNENPVRRLQDFLRLKS